VDADDHRVPDAPLTSCAVLSVRGRVWGCYAAPVSEGLLAYFITFRCYGTWLHGDARGSMDRHTNVYDTPALPPDPSWERRERTLMRHTPLFLTPVMRESVHSAIADLCEHHGWLLYALAVQSNHVHVVVAAAGQPAERVMAALKARATRDLRASGLIEPDRRVWSRHGSTRYVWTERDLDGACAYVINGQRVSADA
jgi:REP element-mobilizing transposase RayT